MHDLAECTESFNAAVDRLHLVVDGEQPTEVAAEVLREGVVNDISAGIHDHHVLTIAWLIDLPGRVRFDLFDGRRDVVLEQGHCRASEDGFHLSAEAETGNAENDRCNERAANGDALANGEPPKHSHASTSRR